MAQIRRANPYLEDILSYLEDFRSRCESDADARDRLSTEDNDWIDNEILHCIIDKRYFLSNYFAYRDEKEGFKGLYPFFDSQEILYEEFQKLKKRFGRVRALVLKARQMGSTTYSCGEFVHETIFYEHRSGIMVGKDEKQKNKMFSMYSSALDFIPWWMKPRQKSFQTGSLIEFDEKDEHLRATRPGLKTIINWENANKPSGAGRGDTFNCAVLSELAFWENGSQLSKSLFPTMNTPDGFYVMESTPNGRNDFWHNLWRRAEAGKVDWYPVYIPYYRRDKTYSIPLQPGEVFEPNQDEIEMRTQVLKKDNYRVPDEVLNWARKRREEFIATDGDDKMFSQEYSSNPEESFQTSATTAYPRPVINRMMKRTEEPKWVGEISFDFELNKARCPVREVLKGEEVQLPERHERFHIWERPQVGETYCVGVDVSLGGEGGDYSCCQVVKSSSLMKDQQVACWHGLIDPENLAEVVLAICMMYNEALAAVEVNNMGLVTNNKLVRAFEYENIYRYKHLDKLTRWQTDLIGFLTNEKTKMAIMSKMSKSLVEDTIEIPCKWTMDEFNDFTEDGAEGDGAHDDYVMALLIALYCAHENEYRDMREGKVKEAVESKNIFEVKDRFGSVVGTTTSQGEAQRIAAKHLGAITVRTSANTATAVLAGKKRKVPADFQNTDYSPVHDGNGTARQLYEDGYEPEQITPEMIREYEDMEEATTESPDAWLYV